MRTTIIFSVFLVTCLAYVSAQNFPSYLATDVNNGNEEVPPSVATTISTFVVDTISKKLQVFADLFDVKIRAIRFLASLYTTDNLQLLKRAMHLGLRFGNWLYTVIPESTTEGQHTFLSFLFPQVNQPFTNDDNGLSGFTFDEESSNKEEPPKEPSPPTESRDTSPSLQGSYNNYQNDRNVRNLNNLINARRYYY